MKPNDPQSTHDPRTRPPDDAGNIFLQATLRDRLKLFVHNLSTPILVIAIPLLAILVAVVFASMKTKQPETPEPLPFADAPDPVDDSSAQPIAMFPIIPQNMANKKVPDLWPVPTIIIPGAPLSIPWNPVPTKAQLKLKEIDGGVVFPRIANTRPREVNTVLLGKGSVTMKTTLSTPRHVDARAYLLRRGGGSQEGEAAVLRALRWLKKTQDDDGSWPKCKPAMTGLALLCFLAHDEIPGRSEEFGDTVKRAIHYLMSTYDGQRFRFSDGNEYAYLIATYALCEAYGMTLHPGIGTVAESALKRIINGQHPSGGWDYKMVQNDRDDTSYMGWAAQALNAAIMANMFYGDPEWKDKMNKTAKLSNNGFLKNGGAGGGFGYTGKGRGGLTGVGTLCMQLHGMAQHQQVLDSLRLMDEWRPGWYAHQDEWRQNYMSQRFGDATQYYYYYATQAKFHDGGGRWKSWNDAMLPAYIKAQYIEQSAIKDMQGIFVDIGWWENGDGAHHTDGHVMNGDIVDREKSIFTMDTCLAVLQLMVYYRYLPKARAVTTDKDDATRQQRAARHRPTAEATTVSSDIEINTKGL